MASTKINNTQINKAQLPQHIAIIMDGNGRWAKKRLMPRTMGHRAGMTTLKTTVKTCAELGIKYLTVFAFSTENWKRPIDEVDYLMKLLVEYLGKELQELHQENVRINVIGAYQDLPSECLTQVEKALSLTKDNTGMVFNIALNYGARREIIRAVQNISARVREGLLSPEDIDENTIASELYSCNIPDPDLLIRTAGEMRISNFLLWQIAYTELWFSSKLWPEFTREELLNAINDYGQRERRFGGLTK
ncbi:MAG: isoprenyl transferase [Syntrophomonadaceae bacterium]